MIKNPILYLFVLITSCIITGCYVNKEPKILSRVVIENPIVYIDEVYSGGQNTGINAHIFYDGHHYKIEEITKRKIYSNQLIEETHLNIPDKFVLVAYEQPIFIFSERPVDTLYVSQYNFSKFSKDIE